MASTEDRIDLEFNEARSAYYSQISDGYSDDHEERRLAWVNQVMSLPEGSAVYLQSRVREMQKWIDEPSKVVSQALQDFNIQVASFEVTWRHGRLLADLQTIKNTPILHPKVKHIFIWTLLTDWLKPVTKKELENLELSYNKVNSLLERLSRTKAIHAYGITNVVVHIAREGPKTAVEKSQCQSIDSAVDVATTNDTTTPDLDAEFQGYTVVFVRSPTGFNHYTIEEVALAAIGALKEEALERFSARVLEFNHVDEFRPNPVRITLRYIPPGPESKATRGALMWSIKTLVVRMITFNYYRPLTFLVKHRQDVVWAGALSDREQAMSLPNGTSATANTLAVESAAASLSLVPVPMPRNATTVELKQLAPLKDDPHYEVIFGRFPFPLYQPEIFESIMELLIALGKFEATETRLYDHLVLRRAQAWIFLMEVSPPVQEHRFKQFQEVAILEAFARYYVQIGVYSEMTVTFKVNGENVARGCITKRSRAQEWCRGLFAEDDARFRGSNGNLTSS
ncbi:MAG: hypothetical protein Q9212_002873 [Teloschistes hypoglaucus]